ncbi:MAG TPA: flagellar export chaperone FliS [Acidimicrobiales bacterium]|nr:flagellar export chaperone FliS [Acidimicrobiales bacterium]
MPPASIAERYLNDSIATADPATLIVMLYDRLALDLARAVDALEDKRDLEVAHNNLVHAQDIVVALQASLRPELWSGADKLVALYAWLSARLVEANLRKDVAIIRECSSLIAPLHAAWREAAQSRASADAVA